MTDEGSKIVSLAEVRDKRDGPDPEFIFVDKHGKWFTFIVDFHDDELDADYSFHIWARDFDDAERRLAKIKENAKVVGKLHSEIPA